MRRGLFGSNVPNTWAAARASLKVGIPRQRRARRLTRDPRVPQYEVCRHEKCYIVAMHEAHDGDFVSPRDLRAKRDTARRLAPYVIIRYEQAPSGQVAIVRCDDCEGKGCAYCQDEGAIPMYRWWQRRNAKRSA